MSAGTGYSPQTTFFVCLSQARASALLLDYDGTLAPLRPERDQAVPYPEVPALLRRIVSNGHTRVVLISGRPAKAIPPLLGLEPPPEIWGSHGMERLYPNGRYEVRPLPPASAAAFAMATASLDREGLSKHVEWKAGSIAVHWRGLSRQEVTEVWTTAMRVLQPISSSAGLALSDFDGGIEMRVQTPNKGDAVRAILAECDGHCPVAYLGDDTTDEDAFAAVNPVGLTALVRQERRATAAQLWLRPPEELLSFLEQWLHACGGDL